MSFIMNAKMKEICMNNVVVNAFISSILLGFWSLSAFLYHKMSVYGLCMNIYGLA